MSPQLIHDKGTNDRWAIDTEIPEDGPARRLFRQPPTPAQLWI